MPKYDKRTQKIAVDLWFEIYQDEKLTGRKFEDILKEKLPKYDNKVQAMFKEVYGDVLK